MYMYKWVIFIYSYINLVYDKELKKVVVELY